jgi:hypothetical protein
MANDVFANGREISCKKADGKTIAAFPDVCFTPPENPATPPGIPVPYPNTAFAKDTSSGSKNVKISDQEIMLKNKSFFKTSTGDEAGCAAKKGIITSKIKGKAYFVSWSMDVKAEGENVARHIDMTTHNHASPAANEGAPWAFIDSANKPPADHPCHDDIVEAQKECNNLPIKENAKGNPAGRDCDGTKCAEKMECILVPKGKDKSMCCHPLTTGDHIIEDHWIRPKGELMPDFVFLAEKDGKEYTNKYGPYNGAPTMCVNRSRYSGKHGIGHGTRGVQETELIGKEFLLGKAKKIALESHSDANPDANCTEGCVKSQLDAFYGKDDSKKCHTPNRKQPLKQDQRKKANARVKKRRRSR